MYTIDVQFGYQQVAVHFNDQDETEFVTPSHTSFQHLIDRMKDSILFAFII